MSAPITNIQLTSRDTVNFYADTEIVRNMSAIVPPASTYAQRIGNDVLIFQPPSSVAVPIPPITRDKENQLTTNTPFQFSTSTVEQIGAKTYTPLSPTDGADVYEQRAIDVLNYIYNNIFKGCCDCGTPSDAGCSIQWQFNSSLESGAWYYTSGILLFNFTSYLNQDWQTYLEQLPSGSQITLVNETDPSIIVVFEIGSYSVLSGLASWSASIVDGASSFVDGVVWCVSFQPALGGGGGSQGFQDVLIVDPDLTQNNETNANGTGYSWLDFSFWEIFASQYIEFNTVVGSQESDLYIDPDAASLSQSSSTETGYFRLRTTAGAVTAGISVSDTGSNSSETEMTAYDVITTVTDSSYTSQRYQDATAVTDSVVLATNTGEQNISPTVSRMAQINGVNEVNFLVDFTGGVQRNIIRTAKIVAGTAAVNDVLTLSATTGQAEWQAATGGGGGIPAATAAGTDTYTATMTPTVTSYVAGASYLIKFTNANTTVATLNLDGVGAISLVKDVSSPLNAGDIAAGKEILVVYDGTNFQTIGLSTYHAPFNIDCNSDTVNASTTSYYNIYPGSGVDGTEATRQNMVPVSGTVKGYAIQTLSAQGASGSLVFTMRKNGANTTLTVTVAAGSAATIVADNVNTFSVTKQSDLLSYQVQNNSTGTSAQIKSQSFVIESTQ
jgi:hypothetical protein